MSTKKQKTIIVIFSLLVGILLSVGIATAFLLNYNSFSPKGVKVLDDGNNVSLYVDMNDNYTAYRFKFVSQDDSEIIIDSQTNFIDMSVMEENGIEVGNTYKVYACYLGENAGNNSEYSKPITWMAYGNLDAPYIQLDLGQNKLYWEEVDNADYYYVYYQNTYAYTTENFFDLNRIEGGENTIYVIAHSASQAYRESVRSNIITTTLYHNYRNFESISLDSDTKVLTLISVEHVKKINVYIGETEYLVKDVVGEYDTSTEKYVYNINIGFIYKEDKTIGVCPVPDGYNSYSGGILYLN